MSERLSEQRNTFFASTAMDEASKPREMERGEKKWDRSNSR